MLDNIYTVKCKNCTATFDVDKNNDIIQCPYCGTKYDIDDLIEGGATVKAEQIKAEVEKGKQQIEKERFNYQVEQEQRAEFKKSKYKKFLIIDLVICIIGTLLAFAIKRTAAGIIGVVQIGLLVFALLIGSKNIKIKSWVGIISTIIAVVLIIPYWKYSLEYSPSKKYDTFVWSEDIVLAEMLPEPQSNKGSILTNTTKELYIRIDDISDAQYAQYTSACKDKGFTVEAEDDGRSYKAFNTDGYCLELSHIGDSMRIELSPPQEFEEIKWSDSSIAKLLPIPKSTKGRIDTDRSDRYSVYVGNTSLADYNSYVEECIKKGFDIDYSKNENSYRAYNKEGYELSVSYEGMNVIQIIISEPEPKETTALTTKPQETEASRTEVLETQTPKTEAPIAVIGIRPEVKEAIDAYEDFIDTYIEFMDKYKNANGSEMLGLLTEYMEYMDKLSEYEEKMDALEGELSDAELAYYSEVMMRCSQKLLSAV